MKFDHAAVLVGIGVNPRAPTGAGDMAGVYGEIDHPRRPVVPLREGASPIRANAHIKGLALVLAIDCQRAVGTPYGLADRVISATPANGALVSDRAGLLLVGHCTSLIYPAAADLL